MDIETFGWLIREGFYPVEPDKAGEGAQLITGQWYMPRWGCDTMRHIKDNLQPAVQADAGNCPIRCDCLESKVECHNLGCLDRSTA